MGAKRARDNPQCRQLEGFSKAGPECGPQAQQQQIAPVESVRPPEILDNPRSIEEDNPEDESWFDRMVEPFDPPAEEGDADSDLAKEVEESETEAGQAKAATIPVRPAQKEVDEHMLTHLPYRAWCPHCVSRQGQGKTTPQGPERRQDNPHTCTGLDVHV